MTRHSQSMRDHILQMLENNGGKMERAFLRRRLGLRYAIFSSLSLPLSPFPSGSSG